MICFFTTVWFNNIIYKLLTQTVLICKININNWIPSYCNGRRTCSKVHVHIKGTNIILIQVPNNISLKLLIQILGFIKLAVCNRVILVIFQRYCEKPSVQTIKLILLCWRKKKKAPLIGRQNCELTFRSREGKDVGEGVKIGLDIFWLSKPIQ